MNDLFKVAEFFLNYLLGNKNFIGEKSLKITAEILNQLRRILILVVMTFGSLTLFCMGMSYLIERLLNNLDNGQALFTPSIWFILGFLIICISVMVYTTRKQSWLDIFNSEKQVAAPPVPVGGNAIAIESVLGLLILDFIKERELKREQEKNQSKRE